MAVPKYEALHTHAANSFGGHVDADPSTYIPAGDRYWSTVADGGSTTLLAAFQTLLAAAVASTTVVLNANGTITITWGSSTHTYTFANAATMARLGFAADLTPAAAAFTSTKQVLGLWQPGKMPADRESPVGTVGRWHSSRFHVGGEGYRYSTTMNRWRTQRHNYVALLKSKVWVGSESLVNESFEKFWSTCLDSSSLSASTPFRYHPDLTSATYDGTYVDLLEDGWEPKPRRRGYDGLWDLDLKMQEYTHEATGGGF